MARGKRYKRNYRWMWGLLAIALCIVTLVAAIIGVAGSIRSSRKSATTATLTTTTAQSPKTVEPVSVTVGSTGDLLLHTPLVSKANYFSNKTNDYEYDDVFTYIAPYYQKYDYMVANFEGTIAGDAYEYKGYPCFNVPDSFVDAMIKSGIDLSLTANNHSYDTRHIGFTRTREVMKAKKLPFIGTRDAADKPYIVADVGGIKIGMYNTTYQTARSDGKKALNGILMQDEDAPLINSFDYNNIDAFYSEMQTQIDAMKKDGAEAIMVFIHWGNEYQLTPNSHQKKIAQKLCDLGVDVIVGGHPHVIQPVEVLTSSVSGKTTVCAYSLGNELSNQRIAYMDMKTGHTEDGMIFETTFTRATDGTVSVTAVNVLPTWVHMYKSGGKTQYQIVPLDASVDYAGSFNLSASGSGAANAKKSYERTMALVEEGLKAFRDR